MLTLAVINYKGGSAKTTTAVFLAHALHEVGRRVLILDADPQGTAQRWSDLAGGFPMPVAVMPTRAIHRDLPGMLVGDRFDTVIIDTPPVQEARGVVLSAMIAASDVLIPLAPVPVEVDRVGALRGALSSAADMRVSAQPPRAAVLLTRTVSQAASTKFWRTALEDDGWPVLRASVARLERYAQAFGDQVDRASASAYGDAATELLASAGETT